MNKEEQYSIYLENHIQNVKNGFGWMKLVVLPVFDISKDTIKITQKLIEYHDYSKYIIEEFDAYTEYFYGDKKLVQKDFDYAWLHHIHNNPHHWQYWLLQGDDGNLKALDMPMQYIIEMICDWWSFSWAKNDLFEIFKWYDDNKEKQILSTKTKEIVESILFELKKQLFYVPELRRKFE